MENKKSVWVCLLTYNEEDNLKVLIPQINEEFGTRLSGVDYSINVVDARKTTDNTKQLCKDLNVNYFVQPGFGQADAMRYAIKLCDKDLFFILDADCSHNPKYIPDMYNNFINNDCDIVIGSRYVPGGVTNDKLSSQIMSHILNSVMRSILGLKTKDISGGYRLYDAKQLKAIKIASENFEMQQEILARMKANNRNIKIGETPIIFEQRLNGTSTRRLMLYIWCYIKNIFRIIKILH